MISTTGKDVEHKEIPLFPNLRPTDCMNKRKECTFKQVNNLRKVVEEMVFVLRAGRKLRLIGGFAEKP